MSSTVTTSIGHRDFDDREIMPLVPPDNLSFVFFAELEKAKPLLKGNFRRSFVTRASESSSRGRKGASGSHRE